MSHCKGLVFKYIENTFMSSNNEFVSKETMRPMRSMSCKGCESCNCLMDTLSENVLNGENPVFPDNKLNGNLYSLNVINIQEDWQTGIVDDFDLSFQDYKERDYKKDPEKPFLFDFKL